MTFKDIHYTVKASTSKDKLELLKGVSGYFASGKMTALMGSSGMRALKSDSSDSLLNFPQGLPSRFQVPGKPP